MNRKKPFSGKAKKQQLKEKRERNRARNVEEPETTQPEEASVPVPPSPSPVTSGRGNLRTVFAHEPKHVIEARKKDATRPLDYASDRGNSQSIYAFGIHNPENQPPILIKPKWHHTMTTDELIQVEEEAYAQWIHTLEHAQAQTDTKVNLYERNIEVWRQLWRVIERSSVLIHLADARCPLLHISDRLMQHIHHDFPSKRVMIVLTKADLVSKERVDQWVLYLQQRYGVEIPVLAYTREAIDQSNATLMRTVGQLSAGILSTDELHNDPATLTIGFVGEPNVGKSSLLNSLFERKLVSVSATPGHTKHLQTHFFDRVELLERPDIRNLIVCDCPGVVFPRFGVPLALQILFGSFPIAQTREPFSAIRFIAENCVPELHELYKLEHVEDDDPDWSPFTLCESYAKKRGFHVKGGKYDIHRAANQLLRDTLNGKKVVLAFPPPL